MDAIWKCQPALVILDCGLPGRPGMVLLDDLRGSALLQDLPVMMLTAPRSEWHAAIAHEHGADFYMRKPFEPHALLITVARLISEAARRSVADVV